jgi:hypothetical protein
VCVIRRFKETLPYGPQAKKRLYEEKMSRSLSGISISDSLPDSSAASTEMEEPVQGR